MDDKIEFKIKCILCKKFFLTTRTKYVEDCETRSAICSKCRKIIKK